MINPRQRMDSRTVLSGFVRCSRISRAAYMRSPAHVAGRVLGDTYARVTRKIRTEFFNLKKKLGRSEKNVGPAGRSKKTGQ